MCIVHLLETFHEPLTLLQGAHGQLWDERERAHMFWGGAGADCSMEGRTDSSSTQYGTACTSSGSSVAVPWMNLENLCTCTAIFSPLMTVTAGAGALQHRCLYAVW